MKNALIIGGSLIAFIILFMGGCATLNKHIFSRTDCEHFNIDNIEVRTGINIPQIVADKCECEEGDKKKVAKFVIDTDQVNLTKYIADNRFEKKNNQYANIGSDKWTKWEAKLDHETAELTVEIDYLN